MSAQPEQQSLMSHAPTASIDKLETSVSAPAPQVPETALMAHKATIAVKNQQYLDYNQYNPIFFSQEVLETLPAGVEMVPSILQIPARDIWTKDRANFLKAGDVMLSAIALARIAQAAGVKLRRLSEETLNVNGVNVLRIEYEATMLLPDGTVITEVGGKEEVYTPGQGHCRERVDTKARRNAMRRLLNIPVTMAEDDVKKPMVIWKAIFRKGGEVDHIVEAIDTAKKQAVAQLYGDTSVNVGEVIDVEAEIAASEMKEADQHGELTLEGLKTQIRSAKTIADITELEKAAQQVAMTTEQRKIVASIMLARKDELSGEVKL